MLAPAIYGVLCLLVGLMAAHRKGGFLLYLILSIALSPLVGVFILLIARPSDPDPRATKQISQK